MGYIPLNEFTCNDTHENYKCQIHLLHDHLIHSCMLAVECTIPFTKPDTKQHRNKTWWNEQVSKEFDHALHWHNLYLQHPQSGFIFEIRKFTRSMYHKKVKQVDSNQKLIKKPRIAKDFLQNKSRDFWSEISKIRRKTHITPCNVEGFSNQENISPCFLSYYKDLYNSVSFDSIILSMLMMSKIETWQKRWI